MRFGPILLALVPCLAISACGDDGGGAADTEEGSTTSGTTSGTAATTATTGTTATTSTSGSTTQSDTEGSTGGVDACLGIDCGAGACVDEEGTARCDCDEGFVAVELTCIGGVDLTVELTGDAIGTVAIGDDVCDTSPCTFFVPTGVSLTAVAAVPNDLQGLTAWTGACAGTDPECTFELDADATLTARFEYLANIAFVSSEAFSVAELQALPGTDIADKADTWCTTAATTAGWHGSQWVAWIGSQSAGITLASRMGSARGWVRTDGSAVADTFADILDGALINPVMFDETGARAPVIGWSGLDLAGDHASAGHCESWTTSDGATSAATGFAGDGLLWAVGLTSTCDTSNHLYCFGVDASDPLPTVPSTGGRFAFQSSGTWDIDTGRAAADAMCADEADSAGLPGTYLAAVSTSTEAYHERFDLNGETWVRVDGQPIFLQASDLADGINTALTSIHLHANGSDSGPGGALGGYVVFGQNCGIGAGFCCEDWTSPTGSTNASGRYAVAFTDFATQVNCSDEVPVYCLQE